MILLASTPRVGPATVSAHTGVMPGTIAGIPGLPSRSACTMCKVLCDGIRPCMFNADGKMSPAHFCYHRDCPCGLSHIGNDKVAMMKDCMAQQATDAMDDLTSCVSRGSDRGSACSTKSLEHRQRLEAQHEAAQPTTQH